MQSILARNSDDYFEEEESACNVKISEVLLVLRQENDDEEYQESDESEVKIEYHENHSFTSKIDSSVKSQKKYRMHTPEIKRLCVEWALQNDAKSAAKKYGVPLKSLKRWLTVGPDRKKGGGRKIRDPEMERRLFEWYHDYHLIKKLPVTSRMIKAKALELTTLPDFNASKGWLEKIKKKYNLQISRSSALRK